MGTILFILISFNLSKIFVAYERGIKYRVPSYVIFCFQKTILHTFQLASVILILRVILRVILILRVIEI